MFKIEYEASYANKFVVYRRVRGWFKDTWERMEWFLTEDEAKSAIIIMADYPKYF